MDTIDRRMMLGAAGLAGVAAMTKLAGAGPLTPPPGPVSPTGRTLDDIYNRIARTDLGVAEPRIPVHSLPGSATALHVISQPGSYCLTDNLQGVAGKSGVEVTASGVTLDLCGFSLRGVQGSAHGITSPGSRENIVVHSGCVESWGGNGIDGNGWYTSTVVRVMATRNGQNGIRVAAACEIHSCLAQANATGVSMGNEGACEATRCVSNTLGIYAQDLSVVRSCAFYGNSVGAEAGRFVSVENTAFRGGSLGLRLSDEGFAIGNAFANVPVAIQVVGAGCFVANNTARNALYVMPPGNSHGPIVNVSGVGDISAVPGANHPWANFIY